MKAEDWIRALAAKGTQGRLRVGYGYTDGGGLYTSVENADCEEFVGECGIDREAARRITLMADAEVMRAVADVVEAARECLKCGPSQVSTKTSWSWALKERISRLDALMEGRGDE